jgi:hypothetical protein
VAQFRQINMGKPSVHHDALEFPDGEEAVEMIIRAMSKQRKWSPRMNRFHEWVKARVIKGSFP